MKIFQPHISIHRLADYAEGRLLPDEQPVVERHVAACSQCDDQVSDLRRLIQLMRSDRSEDAPVFALVRVYQLFVARQGFRPSAPGLRKRVLAELAFESVEMAAGFRTRAGLPGARQLLFHAGENEIDLRIEPVDQAWIVSGQVFGKAAVHDRVLLQGERETRHTALNDLREFVLPPVQIGQYRMILSLEDRDIEIDDIRLGL